MLYNSAGISCLAVIEFSPWHWGISRVFPRPFTYWGGGDLFPIWGGGTSAGGQSVNGGTHEGDIDLMGEGDLTLIDYIIN